MQGIHTIAVNVKKKDKIEAYNDSVQQMYTPVYHYSRKGLLRNRKFIIAYKIKGKRNA